MKKLTLLIAGFAAVLSAGAVNLEAVRMLKSTTADRFEGIAVENAARPVQHQTRAELSMVYDQASAPYTAFYLKNQKANQKFAQAHEMTAEAATQFAGNKITGINFYTGLNGGTGTNIIKNYTVFLTHDLEAEPFYTKDVTVGTTRFEYVEVDLDTPYTIEADKPVFYGIKYTIRSTKDYHLVVDAVAHEGIEGGWVATYDATNAKYVWDNYSGDIGFTCLSATLKGETLPTNRMIIDASAATPVAEAGKPFDFYFRVVNKGANPVKSIDYDYKVGSDAAVSASATFDTPLYYNQAGVVAINGITYQSASKEAVKLFADVTKMDGVANTVDGSTTDSILIIPVGGGFKKNVVVEEFTGNWCGWCPAGIVTMEALREKYNYNGVITVAVHVPSQGTEPMQSDSYLDVARYYGSGGVPDATINRTQNQSPQSFEETEAAILEHAAVPAIGKIELDAKYNSAEPGKLNITATTTFTFGYGDADKNFALSFGVIENGVGPYTQTNYFAGGGSGECGGWEKKPQSVNIRYNDVARQLDGFRGIAGAIPATVQEMVPNTFNYTLTLGSNIADGHNCILVGYLLNKYGNIENAVALPLNEFIEAGVNNVTVSDASAPVEYFNLQGVRVANPENGIFIRRQGAATTKVRM